MVRAADFYLTTAGEYESLTPPRACVSVGRLADAARDDYMLVDIDPPFTESGQNTSQLVLAAKWRGQSLFTPTQWPIPVYVMRVLDESLVASQSLRAEQVSLIAWGTVHQTFAEAAEVARRFQNE